MIWVVTEQGVYLQGVFGPFDSELAAKTCAQQKAADDKDDYHRWCVQPLTADGLGDVVAEYRKWMRVPRHGYWRYRDVHDAAGREDQDRYPT